MNNVANQGFNVYMDGAYQNTNSVTKTNNG